MPSADYAHIADLYDTYVNTTLDIPYWLILADQHQTEILELMCGTGRITLPLLQTGHTITVLDESVELLALLRQKLTINGLAATVQQANVVQFDLGRTFDLIILPFNSFAELQTPSEQLKALQTIRRHLSIGGLFVCTLHNPPIRLQTVDGQLRIVASYPQTDGELVFSMHQSYDEKHQRVHVLQFYEEYARGILQQKRLQKMAFSIIYRSEFAQMASDAGFAVVELFGDYQGGAYQEERSPFMIWHLTRA